MSSAEGTATLLILLVRFYLLSAISSGGYACCISDKSGRWELLGARYDPIQASLIEATVASFNRHVAVICCVRRDCESSDGSERVVCCRIAKECRGWQLILTGWFRQDRSCPVFDAQSLKKKSLTSTAHTSDARAGCSNIVARSTVSNRPARLVAVVSSRKVLEGSSGIQT